ncbi:MAG: hypothetical protein MRJ96_10185 [Nitrospirales bacterium]|nr:hypothetical protein [Nitrospira sp.]MDR4501806.1 hypothetical protein [Nitrospirales bacterium]
MKTTSFMFDSNDPNVRNDRTGNVSKNKPDTIDLSALLPGLDARTSNVQL